MKSWYEIRAQVGGEAEIFIFDDIGFFGITAKDFIDEIRNLPGTPPLNIKINSVGGSWLDGLAIYNFLLSYPSHKTTTDMGVALSIASLIFLAGDRRIMPANSWLFIHQMLASVFGNIDDMRDFADDIERLQSGLVKSYANRSGQTEEKIFEMMKGKTDGTWISAADALVLGFTTETSEEIQIAARAAVSRFDNVPESLKVKANPQAGQDPVTTTEPDPEAKAVAARKESEDQAREIVALCSKAGVADLAGEFLEKRLTVDQVRARLADVDKIRAKCTATGKTLGHDQQTISKRADSYIRAGKNLQEVTDELLTMMVNHDPARINNKLGPEAGLDPNSTNVKINAAEIYARRRKATV